MVDYLIVMGVFAGFIGLTYKQAVKLVREFLWED